MQRIISVNEIKKNTCDNYMRLKSLDSKNNLLKYGCIVDETFEFEEEHFRECAKKFGRSRDLSRGFVSLRPLYVKYQRALKTEINELEASLS
jgi:hypothetical protein